MNILLRCLILFVLAIASTANAAPSVSVTFVMDESGSVSSSNFLLEKQGFINALNSVPTDGGVEVSAIGFASSSSVLVNPTVLTSSSFAGVKSALENNSQSGGGTAMDSAINTAANLLVNSTAPSKIICLATDGYPNSASATTVAANNAKALGINLAPIGIGLDSYGRTFLDSIASNPPIPAPTNFTEFATVVKNDCIGAIKSALNIQMIPETVNFGAFSENNLVSDIQLCSNTESVAVVNKSNQSAQITKVEIIGQDAPAYELVSFMGVSASSLSFPLTLSPGVVTEAKIRMKPSALAGLPGDSSFDAVLNIVGKDSQGVEGTFSTDLVAKTDASADDCLSLKVMDASPTIHSISDFGEPIKSNGNKVEEIDVALAMQNDAQGNLERKGVVADGNARLLLVAKTRKSSGKVRFEITNPALTEAKLYNLQFAPTYKPVSGAKQYDDTGKTTIDLDIVTDPDGNGQVTAILRAGENFLGNLSDSKIDFGVKVCILDDTGKCSSISQEIPLSEHKAPVVLIHGLWANPDSFMKHAIYSEPDAETGLYEELREKGYIVAVVDYCKGNSKTCKENDTYPDHIGPSQKMGPDAIWLRDYIAQVCNPLKNSKISCTRADLVGHSMGGLMSRAFINQNKHYKLPDNFNMGSVRRLITLSTPHIGSGVANLLTKNDQEINSCIRLEKQAYTYPDGYSPITGVSFKTVNKTGREVIDEFIIANVLESKISIFGHGKTSINRVGSAISDLQLGEKTNPFLNGSTSIMAKDISVPIFALYGDIGIDVIGLNLESSFTWLPGNNNVSANNILNYLTGCNISNIFNGEASDGIVPLSSSRWDNYIPSDSYRQSVPFKHTGMGKDNSANGVMEVVLRKLNAPLSDFYLK